MPQKFANRAKSLLQSTINAAATSLLVASGDADEFPVADTGTDPVNTVGKDWFKLVLIDTSGNYEIMHARTRTLGSGTISNIIRGQDGTTAIGFAADSFVVQDFVAEDLNDLLAEQASQATSIADRVTKAEIQNQTYTAFTTGGTGSAYTLNAVPDAATYAANQAFDVTFHAASSGTPTIAVDAQGAKSLMYMNSSGAKVTVGTLIPVNWRSKIIYDGTDFVVQAMPVVVTLTPILRNHMNGFICSTPGSSATLTISEGQCADSTNSVYMSLAAPLAKTTAAWVQGAGGGLDTGVVKPSATGGTCSFNGTVMTCTVAPTAGVFSVGQYVTRNISGITVTEFPGNLRIVSLGTGVGGVGTYNLSAVCPALSATPTTGRTWYNIYSITNATGVTDVLLSLEPLVSGVGLPPGFISARWINSLPITAAGHWESFSQRGSTIVLNDSTLFLFDTQPFVDSTGTGITGPNTNFPVSLVPPNKRVESIIDVTLSVVLLTTEYVCFLGLASSLDSTVYAALGRAQLTVRQTNGGASDQDSSRFSILTETQQFKAAVNTSTGRIWGRVYGYDIAPTLALGI